jgi:hypothetical protein
LRAARLPSPTLAVEKARKRWYNTCMAKKTRKPPEMFRPLLWYLKWDSVDINKDKEDIIVNTINEGSLKQWHWLIKTYGKRVVRNTLRKRLITEFHPESRNLAKVIFGVSDFKHARGSTYK